MYIIIIVFFLISIVLIARLFDIQIFKYQMYLERSERIHNVEKELRPVRGEIFVKNDNSIIPLVTNRDYYLVYSDPREIKDTNAFIGAISSILELNKDEEKSLLKKIDNKIDPYEPVKRKVAKEQMERLKQLGLSGLYFLQESYRWYGEKNIGGHILGFVDYEGVGKYGLEGYFSKELYGSPGVVYSVKDIYGSGVATIDSDKAKSINGSSLVLTIDKNIQYRTCEEIKKGIKDYDARGGTIIVIEPKSGEILAMCSVPDYDPENFNKVENIDVFNNPAIFYPYEPGSIFKPITMAIGIDLKKVTPETTYEDTGEIKIVGQDHIRNSDKKAHGIQTMTQVLEKSLNTGAVFVVGKIGNENFKKYVENFGFGQITGIELDSEVPGNISSLSKRGQIYSMTASFGQGITVTSLQFITAFSSLINGGYLMKPYIVEEMLHGDEVAQKTEPLEVRQIISPNTSSLIIGMMVSSVENGYSKKAQIPGYYVGGKTGTAEVAGPNGKYGDETVHTFIGFAPAYDPKFAILVKMDNPKKFTFSSETATLVFKRLAEYIIHYYNIPPERENPK